MRTRAVLVAAGMLLAASSAQAQKGVPPTTVIVSGYPVLSDRDLIDNLDKVPSASIFLDLLRASGLPETIRKAGSVTMFVPANRAFASMPASVLDGLRKPENRPRLLALLGNHIVPGVYSSARLHLLLRTGKGQAELETINGGKLSIGLNGPSNIVLRSGSAIAADLTIYDVKTANGVVFLIDQVVPPA